MYDNIDSNDSPFVPLLEARLEKDTVTIDSEGLLMGLFKRSKDFLNFK